MIWMTAKSTDVNRRRSARPIRSKTSGAGGRAESAHVVTGLVMARSSGTVRRVTARLVSDRRTGTPRPEPRS